MTIKSKIKRGLADGTRLARSLPMTAADPEILAHLLAGRSGFFYGTMVVAQKHGSDFGISSAGRWLAWVLFLFVTTVSQGAETAEQHELLEPQGSVEVLRKGQNDWVVARTNVFLYPGDAIRTGKDSRATVRLANDSVIRMDQLTVVRFTEPVSPRKRFLINLMKGAAYFFHRERPVQTDFETPLVSGAIRGTEFNLAVAENGRTVLTLLDGEVDLSNAQGQLELKTGDEAVIEPGTAPRKTSVVEGANVIQWCLYYPGVLDASEVPFSDTERQALSRSLDAYQNGNLPAALASYPANRPPASDAERLYLGQLRLSAGQVPEAQQLLDGVTKEGNAGALAQALRVLIAAVKGQEFAAGQSRSPNTIGNEHSSSRPSPVRKGRSDGGLGTLNGPEATESASSLLAASYYAQSRSHLDEALRLARAAVAKSPNFGFGWARVAELEFGFGHRDEAHAALDKALSLSPQNAQALATKGFVLAAEGRFSGARAEFQRAIDLDSALGNAWLGRGLTEFRMGHESAAREDLLVAAALEPNRAALRSYLGKAFAETGDDVRAAKELNLAKRLDTQDPTAWLYSALLNQQRNRINQAIEDLEHSIDLNENRQVYRSELLLDEDRAVRGANLATIYADAGLTDPAFREAARSANRDYANFSSHLFLANSYNLLRDPRQVNLRYEAPWLSEFLLANLLAPIEAGTLSQAVSQQEYGRLFERNRFGLASSTEYQSRGDWAQAGSQYGIFNNFAYSADAFYRNQNGYRPNNDFEQLTLSVQMKYRVGPSDSLYLQGVGYRAEGGDLRQYYDQRSANPGIRIEEKQEPLLIGGWHHEWSPENHTLFLAGRLQDTFTVTNPTQRFLTFERDAGGTLVNAGDIVLPLEYRNELTIYTTELQHIYQQEKYKLIGGGRFQVGDFETRNQAEGFVFVPPTSGTFDSTLERATAYGYAHWEPIEPLLLIAGVSYDWLKYPENFRVPPVNGAETTTDRVSPKAGFIWTPWEDTAIRGAYTRSLGGVTFDQSFQLEPSQVAGFNQTYRSLIPESISGAVSAQRFETIGLALDQKLPTRTYLGISGEWLRSKAVQNLSTYDFVFPDAAIVSSTREELKFDEKTLFVNVNQLLGDEWALGAQYRLSHAELRDMFLDVPSGTVTSGTFVRSQEPSATLHQLLLFVNYNHSCGFFSQAQGIWSSQDNRNALTPQPGDDFWQWNAFVGYRFLRRHGELSVGVLNITDRDYRLNPLTLYSELPRKRTAVVNFKFYF